MAIKGSKKNREKKYFSFWSVTRKFWKEQVVFTILASLSCLFGFLLQNNALKFFYKSIKDLGSARNYMFSLDFGFFNFGKIDFGSSFIKFFLFAFLVVIVYALIVYAHIYYSLLLANKITAWGKKRLFRKLFALKNPQKKEQVAALLTSDIQRFGSFVVFVPNQLYILSLEVVLTVTQILKSEVTLYLALLGIICGIITVVVSFFLQLTTYKKSVFLGNKLIKVNEEEVFLANNRDLIVKKNRIDNYRDSYYKSIEEIQRISDKRDKIQAFSFTLPSYFLVKTTLFILIPFVKDEASFTATNNFVSLIDNARKLFDRMKEYPISLASQKKLNAFLNLPERNDFQKGVVIHEPIEEISLQNLTFGHEKDQAVLTNLNLTFSRGKINQISGRNGLGKSTIVSLILGMLKQQSGKILINDKYNLKELNLVEWRKKIAYSEHLNLVRENLSTGQKQLLALKEIFANLEEKELLIFDEADSCLDPENKEFFFKKLEEASNEKLVIFISHWNDKAKSSY